jgi:peptidoglycan-associated lipoprotein
LCLIFAKQELGMKKSIVTLAAAVSFAALIFGGCAKEAVKPEEPIVPAVQTQPEPAKPVESTTNSTGGESNTGNTAAQEAERLRLKAIADAEQKIKDDAAALAAAQAQQLTNAKAAEENKFETVYFDFDKSDLRQDTRDVLTKNAEVILKSLPGAKIQISGHCDERGSAEYNLALGERRAKSAQKYLTTLGVKADKLSVISYGKEKPAVVGSDEAAWAKNRRAEFTAVK